MLIAAQQISMAFGVAVPGSVQAVTVSRSAGPAGYLTGLKITLLIAAVLLALAAVASFSLHRRHQGSSPMSPWLRQTWPSCTKRSATSQDVQPVAFNLDPPATGGTG